MTADGQCEKCQNSSEKVSCSALDEHTVVAGRSVKLRTATNVINLQFPVRRTGVFDAQVAPFGELCDWEKNKCLL